MDPQIAFATLALLVALAFAFDFMNGFHDAANSIATVVSTGVLRPHYAVAWAAFFNFVAIFIFHLKVAATGIGDASVSALHGEQLSSTPGDIQRTPSIHDGAGLHIDTVTRRNDRYEPRLETIAVVAEGLQSCRKRSFEPNG